MPLMSYVEWLLTQASADPFKDTLSVSDVKQLAAVRVLIFAFFPHKYC